MVEGKAQAGWNTMARTCSVCLACSMVVDVENSDAVLTSCDPEDGNGRAIGVRSRVEPISNRSRTGLVENAELEIHAGPWESENLIVP